MSTALFDERQSFRQPWLWTVMLAIFAIVLVATLQASEGVPWILLGVLVAFVLLLYSLTLSVHVDTEAIHIRYFPLWKKTIPLFEVTGCQACTYRPLLDYGGWGIRYSPGKGWAYNVSGKQGVQLELANGKHILIGSQRPQELATAIAEAKRQA